MNRSDEELDRLHDYREDDTEQEMADQQERERNREIAEDNQWREK